MSRVLSIVAVGLMAFTTRIHAAVVEPNQQV
jgi:hypothetical protein